MISQTGEENYYSSSTEIEEDCDTMESIDEALPPKLNIHNTKKTHCLNQYQGKRISLINSMECQNNTYGIGIDAKERSNSPKLSY